MLKLILLSSLLLAAATATQHSHGQHHQHQRPEYFCDDPVAATVVSGQRDFTLTTRTRSNAMSYSSSLKCEFNAISETSAFLVEIESFSVSTGVLTISSDGKVLFHGSSLQKFESSLVTPSRSLKVQFDANDDASLSSGVSLRVGSFDSDGCPPGWTSFKGACYGTSRTSGLLDFGEAQRACNSLRANLMQRPPGYAGSIKALVHALPYTWNFAWAGLTDLENRFSPKWMDGRPERSTEEISCDSHGAYSSCFGEERCATVLDTSVSSRPEDYSVFMTECKKQRNFICSMPPGGTDVFYPVPGYSTIRWEVVIPVILVSLKLLFWLLFLTRLAFRRWYLQSAPSAAGCVNAYPKAFEGPGSA